MVQDLATQWIQAYPCKNKTSQETQRSLQKFLEPERKPKVIYTDNSLEFGKACEDLSWNHCTSTPLRSETNGIAERAVRRVKEDTSAVLLQSGLNECWLADSMECYTYLRNVTDLLSDGKTPYERRFGEPFQGPIIPFGSLVEYYSISAKDQSRIHQFGKKVLPGLFLGYALYAGGIWKGDVLIADLEELETMDASEIYSKRLNAKEVIFPKQGEFIFPIADGRIKTPGGDQDLRTSTLIRERPTRGESHVDFLGESEGSLPPPHDSFPDAGEAMNDFQQYIERIESVSPESKVSRFCKEAGFMRIVEVGQYLVTKDTGDFRQFRSVACREYTLPRDDPASQPKGWIQGNIVLEVTTSFQHVKYGIGIRIWSVNQDNSQSWDRISYGTIKYVVDSNQDNTEIPADPQEDQVPQTSIKVIAARSKAKAKPQQREPVDTPNIIPIHNTRKKMD